MPTAPISVSASGPNPLVAAVPGRRIRVLGYLIVAGGAVSVQWQDGAATILSGVMGPLAAGGVLAAPVVPPIIGQTLPWLETGTGQSLVLNLSAAIAVGGHLVYDVA